MDVSLNLLSASPDDTLLPDESIGLDETISFTAPPVRGAGWYGRTSGLHTVAISVQNFTGRIAVEASIATTPGDADWYSVLPGGVPYIQYPRPGTVILQNMTGETSLFGFNFVTNAVWLRASLDRSYIFPNFIYPFQLLNYGRINYVMVNY